MRNLFLILMLVMGLVVNAQLVPIRNTAHLATTTTSYTDDFESLSTGDLDGQGGWTVIDGALVIAEVSSENVVKGNASFYNAAIYDGTYTADQYAWDTIYLTEYASAGPLVLGSAGSGGSYYAYFYNNSGVSSLIRVVNGSASYIDATGSSHSDGDVIRIEAEVGASATLITCYINGVKDSSIGSSGTYSDSNAARLTSGSPGVFVFENNSVAYSTYSAGGNL